MKCITHYMGGGFGSKFGPESRAPRRELARKARAAVKLMLDRERRSPPAATASGTRQGVKIAGTKDGKITALESKRMAPPVPQSAAGLNFQVLPYIYTPSIPNLKKENVAIRVNAFSVRAWRAPGHPQSCVMTEWPLDDLAAKLGIDPLQMRLKNLPANSDAAIKGAPTSLQAIQHTLYTTEIQKAAELAEWDKKWHPPGKGPGKGPIKHGIGMALHTSGWWWSSGQRRQDHHQ